MGEHGFSKFDILSAALGNYYCRPQLTFAILGLKHATVTSLYVRRKIIAVACSFGGANRLFYKAATLKEILAYRDLKIKNAHKHKATKIVSEERIAEILEEAQKDFDYNFSGRPLLK